MSDKLLAAARSMARGGVAIVRSVWVDLVNSGTVLSTLFFLCLFYYWKVKRALRTIESDSAVPMTIKHNLKSLKRRLNRMLLLISALSALEQLPHDARILVIGTRNEWDLYLLRGSGFRFDNWVGPDLISYTPKILLGDMHAMPFADGEFDVVLCGWTLSYSAAPRLACEEMSRVCKPGGTIGIGVEYFDGDEAAERHATGGYLLQDERLAQRVNSVAAILELFPAHGAVFFSHDAPLRRSAPCDARPSNCAVIFQNC